MYFDKEAFVAEIKKEVAENGDWYIDCGINTDAYKNCPTQSVADYAARRLQNESYNVFLDRCGRGLRIPEGTLICYRVFPENHYRPRPLDEF